VHYAAGLRVRGLFVPGFLLSPFLQQYQALNSLSVGGEFVRRKGELDIVVSLDLSFYSPPDGNWLGANKDPTVDTHYVHMQNLDFLSVDVAFIWNHDLLPWLGVMVGGGVGLGVVLGDVYLINNASGLCNAANAGDPSQCHPVSPEIDPQTGMPIGEIKPGAPDFQQKLDATARTLAACQMSGGVDCRDTADHPHWHPSSDKPPVMAVVNLVVGFKFKLHRHLNVNLSGGFRNGFFVGVGPEYVF
jgi:hypothetical protein